MLLGAGLRITPPNLVLGPPLGDPLLSLTADNMLITVDQDFDRGDADPSLLGPPAVIAQSPLAGTPVEPNVTVSAIIAIGYPVPMPRGDWKPTP